MNGMMTITLKSDLCVSSGERMSSIVDSDVCFDTDGLPNIPARRIRGILRENALDILAAIHSDDNYDETTFFSLFGKPGAGKPGKLMIDSAYLPGHEKFCRAFQSLKVSDKSVINKQMVLESLTTLRKQTAINPLTGIARTGSLRNMRVIKHFLGDGKETKFLCRIGISDSDDKSKKLLKDCIRTLRHMGLNRTRGLGEVFASYEDLSVVNTKTNPADFFKDQKELSYMIRLKAPMITGEANGVHGNICDYIPGSMLLGWFAGTWLSRNRATVGDKAHENEEFNRIFLSGQVKFGQALLCDAKEQLHVIPMSTLLSKDKMITTNLINSPEPLPETKSKCPSGYYPASGSVAAKREPNSLILQHHSRPYDKAKGKADGENGSAFFQYEALDSDQLFAGKIRGPGVDLQLLADILEAAGGTVKMGRSRGTQYGYAQMSLFKSKPSKLPETITINPQKEIAVLMESDTILTDTHGFPCADPRNLLSAIITDGEKKLSIQKTWMKTTLASGYRSHWRLPLPQQPAISKGSVFLVRNISDEDITIPMRMFAGLRIAEGFGQLIAWDKDQTRPFETISVSQLEDLADDCKRSDASILDNEIVFEALLIALKKKAALHGRDQAKKETISKTALSHARAAVLSSRDLVSLQTAMKEFEKSMSYKTIRDVLLQKENDFSSAQNKVWGEITKDSEILKEVYVRCSERESVQYMIFREQTLARLEQIRNFQRKEEKRGGTANEDN